MAGCPQTTSFLNFFTLEDYVSQGILFERQCERLIQATQNRKNILIIGACCSGKTTFANALLNEIGKTNDRIVIIQDVPELQCSTPNTVFLRKRDYDVSITRLLHATIRIIHPDRIIVDEVRNSAAFDLLKAWNTGYSGGMATIHANSALEGLTRLEQLIKEANMSTILANSALEGLIPKLIAQTVNLVVFIEKTDTGRKIKEIATVMGYQQDDYVLEYF